jgi:hypothetical protein
VCLGQSLQWEDPVDEEYFPGGQSRQIRESFEYLPTSQRKHSLEFETKDVPKGHVDPLKTLQ